MSKEGNRKKDELLGEPYGTAANRLRKALFFKYVQLAGHDICHRCSHKIEKVRDFSIEHKIPWQSSADPKISFFDLDGVAFSHLKCNCAASTGAPKRKEKHGLARYRRGCRCDICRETKSKQDPRRGSYRGVNASVG